MPVLTGEAVAFRFLAAGFLEDTFFAGDFFAGAFLRIGAFAAAFARDIDLAFLVATAFLVVAAFFFFLVFATASPLPMRKTPWSIFVHGDQKSPSTVAILPFSVPALKGLTM